MSHDDALDALIATAKAHDVPPEGAEDQAWAAFARSGGGGRSDGGSDLPGAAEIATVAGVKGVGLALKLVLAVAVTSAAAVGVARWSAPSPEPAEPPTQRLQGPASVAEPPPVGSRSVSIGAAPVDVPEPPTASVPAPSPSRAPVESTAARESRQVPSVAPASASTLAQEARLVGSMWNALDRGDAQRALSLAQTHRVRFNGGPLTLEARGAALAARCVLGRPTDLHELEIVQNAAAPAVAKRISSACTKKP